MPERRKLFSIRAWGHPVFPDLDYESDYDDRAVYGQYPMISVAVNVPITRAMIEQGLSHGRG
jgi:hypothetical protein